MHNVYAVIAYHYDDSRLAELKLTISSFAEMQNFCNVKLVVQTNASKQEDIQKIKELVKDFDFLIETESPAEGPFYLTWCHKHHMKIFLEKEDFSHFIYIEDDMPLSVSLFKYWNRTIEFFRDNTLNFIPGFLRIEKDIFGQNYLLDITEDALNRSRVIELSGRKFIVVGEPYHGFFIMDRDLVKEHVKSPFFNHYACGINYGIREMANLGNMYSSVPEGFSHKSLIPVDEYHNCFIWHSTNAYRNAGSQLHAVVEIERFYDIVIK